MEPRTRKGVAPFVFTAGVFSRACSLIFVCQSHEDDISIVMRYLSMMCFSSWYSCIFQEEAY